MRAFTGKRGFTGKLRANVGGAIYRLNLPPVFSLLPYLLIVTFSDFMFGYFAHFTSPHFTSLELSIYYLVHVFVST
jgi:hypothetical protein